MCSRTSAEGGAEYHCKTMWLIQGTPIFNAFTIAPSFFFFFVIINALWYLWRYVYFFSLALILRCCDQLLNFGQFSLLRLIFCSDVVFPFQICFINCLSFGRSILLLQLETYSERVYNWGQRELKTFPFLFGAASLQEYAQRYVRKYWVVLPCLLSLWVRKLPYCHPFIPVSPCLWWHPEDLTKQSPLLLWVWLQRPILHILLQGRSNVP